MNKHLTVLVLASIIFLSGGTSFVSQQVATGRAPAQNKDLGLIRTETSLRNQREHASPAISVPKIEKRRDNSEERIKSVENALTRKMASDARYTRVFTSEDLPRISACSVAKAASQIGIDQFKADIAVQGTQGNQIFFHCMINIQAARAVYNQARGIASPVKNSSKKPHKDQATPYLKPSTVAQNNSDSDMLCTEQSYCNGPREGDPDFMGPVRPQPDAEIAHTE